MRSIPTLAAVVLAFAVWAMVQLSALHMSYAELLHVIAAH